MILLLYALTAAALLALAHRFVRPLPRASFVVLFLLPCAFTGWAMLTGRVMAPVDWTFDSEPLKSMRAEYGIGTPPHNGVATDIYCAILPWRAAVRSSLAHGEWPLWNPFVLCGDILAATAQPAPYSPFTLIALLLPVAASFTFTAAITFFVAGLGAYLFARELECGEWPSFVAAAGWMYATSMAIYLLWPLALCWAFFPLILLGARRAVVSPGVRSWALLTVSLTLQLLAGHPETVLHTTVLGAAYGVFEMVRARKVIRPAMTAAAAGVATLLLCAIYLLPILEAMPQTAEYVFRTASYTAVRAASNFGVLVRLANDFIPYLHLRLWVHPRINEAQAESAAAGSLILALAAYAAWRVRGGAKWFFLVAGVFCLAARLGWAPLAHVLREVPLFKMTINERLGFAAAFCMVILAAMACEEIVRRRGDRTAAAVTLAVVLAILGVTTVTLLRSIVTAKGYSSWGDHAVFAELALLGAAVVLFAVPARERWIVPILLVLLVAQRWLEVGRVWPAFPARAAYPSVPLLEPLKNVREPFRIVGLKFAFVPGSNVVYGLEDARGYGAMTYIRLHETFQAWCEPQAVWFNRIDDLRWPMLSMMNVRYAVAETKEAVPPGWRKVGEQGSAMLLENERVLPRAFIPRTVSVGESNAEIVDRRLVAATDFLDRAWISANVPRYERDNGPGVVALKPAKYGFDLDARMERDGWIVVSETAWRGWRGYLDGRRVEMQRANNAFISIYVPAGAHSVRLRYWPDSFVRGRAISAAAIGAIVVFAWFRRRSGTFRSHR